MLLLVSFLVVLGSYIPILNAARPRCEKPVPGGETVTVLENATLNYIVFTYEGSDRDYHRVIFTPRETISPFFFDGKSVNEEYFKLNDILDFETKNQFIFTNIYATHVARSNIGSLCPPLTVNVLPVNEFTPVFDPSVLVVNVPEGLPEDTTVAILNCTDGDKEPTGSPEGCSQIIIQSGDNVHPRFKITNKQIVTTNNAINYDTGDVTFTLIVAGIDSSTLDSQKTGSMAIIINIDPVNVSMPSFQDLSYSISLPESTPVFKEVFDVNATDRNKRPLGDLAYKITDGNAADTFMICQTTGKMFLKRPLDFESDDSLVYYVTVTATDDRLTSTAVVNVTITDVNDNVPICTPTYQDVTIDEKTSIGKTVASINCTDEDAGSVLLYRITSGDCDRFQITPSGDIIVTNVFAAGNIVSTFHLKIQISDGFFESIVWVSVNTIKPICCETFKIPE
uniref:Protocadherin Fat 3-like isoform X2 n=1 Tax=Crassostrea virginica TaxID=6565 RepID=A0A8B8BFG8_CRAVI|nr:protocadherin Fat 3-like isoform X2 [Crassostrea virginica]